MKSAEWWRTYWEASEALPTLEEFFAAIQDDALESAASLGERNDPDWVKNGWAQAIRNMKPGGQ